MATATEPLVRDRSSSAASGSSPPATGTIDVLNPATEEVDRPHPRGHAPRTPTAPCAAARAAFDGWAQTSPYERAGSARRSAPSWPSAATSSPRSISSELGMPIAPLAHDPGGPAVGHLLLDARARRADRLGGGGRQLADRARAGRRGGRDHALELSAAPDRATRWRRRSPPAAPSCSSRARSCRSTRSCSPRSATRSGLPAGVFNLVTGTGPVVGEALVAHPETDMVSFTGSTRAGRRVSELAARERQAGVARAGRQVAERDPRRRRPRAGGDRRRGQVLPQLGPDLQRPDAHARAARASSSEAERIAAVGGREAFTPGDPFADGTTLGRSCPRPSASACAATSRRARPRGRSS